jgi:hypothetical protein
MLIKKVKCAAVLLSGSPSGSHARSLILSGVQGLSSSPFREAMIARLWRRYLFSNLPRVRMVERRGFGVWTSWPRR